MSHGARDFAATRDETHGLQSLQHRMVLRSEIRGKLSMTNKHDGHQSNSSRVKVQGMHCPNCEVLIERRFKKISGVRRVNANHVTGIVDIVHYGALDVDALQNAIGDEEYTVTQLQR